MSAQDHRGRAPATARNRDPILQALREVLPPSGLVLEVASGTGEHAVHFARALPGLTWQPSDPSPEARRSIAAWTEAEGLANILEPLELDAAAADWPVARADAMVCINMVHISPREATEGLMRGAGRLLASGAPLYLYGPYRRGERPLEAGNHIFDQGLRQRDPRWGLREVDAVTECAERNGLRLEQLVEMPANNLSLVFRKG